MRCIAAQVIGLWGYGVMRLGGYEQLHPLRGAHRLVPRPPLTPNLCCSVALSERRGIINPRRGWQPCVASYFADLGVGDMRGPPMGAPMMPPRRRWQAVITPHDPTSHPVIHSTLHATPWWKRQPATTSGVAIWVGHHHALPACRHDPAWRNTGLRTAATPRGVANYLASRHRAATQR